ncbi:MAG: RDD family protein [bacterium]
MRHTPTTLLDTTLTVESPEGIELQLSPAGPVVRAYAAVIDLLIRATILGALALGLSVFGRMGMGLSLVIFFLLEWFYPVYFEVRHQGATPGKRLFGIRVLNTDATPVGLSASMIRNLLRSVDMLPGIYTVGLLSTLFSRHFQRLGDIVAGTVVIYANRYTQSSESNGIEAIVPSLPLLPDEQQALLNFSERSPQLTPERSRELANLCGPLIQGEPRPYRHLLGIANWLKERA